MPSDVVTWEVCPDCCGPAAVGWIGNAVTEIDCAAGCRLSEASRTAITRFATPPGELSSAGGRPPPGDAWEEDPEPAHPDQRQAGSHSSGGVEQRSSRN